MEQLSDTQIRAGLRSVLARHGIDTAKASFTCTKGVVRLLGQLVHRGAVASESMRPYEMDSLETDLRGVKGVARVHFDLANWQRERSGRWRAAKGA
jgi:hypothetical protein